MYQDSAAWLLLSNFFRKNSYDSSRPVPGFRGYPSKGLAKERYRQAQKLAHKIRCKRRADSKIEHDGRRDKAFLKALTQELKNQNIPYAQFTHNVQIQVPFCGKLVVVKGIQYSSQYSSQIGLQ